MVDEFGTPRSFANNVELEYQRNAERYEFLKWGAQAFDNFQVVPPGTGICHQVNLEYIAQVVWSRERDGTLQTIAVAPTAAITVATPSIRLVAIPVRVTAKLDNVSLSADMMIKP